MIFHCIIFHFTVHCALTIEHRDLEPLSLSQMGNSSTIRLEGARQKYPNLKRIFERRNLMTNPSLVSLIPSGICCWEIYDQRQFKGEKTILYPDDVLHFSVNVQDDIGGMSDLPMSIKILDCDNL